MMDLDDFDSDELEFEAYQDSTVWRETVEIPVEVTDSLPQLNTWF